MLAGWVILAIIFGKKWVLEKCNLHFKQVNTSPTTIAEGQPGEFKFGVDYKVQYDEDYEEGDYQARLVYTITVA